MPNNSKIGSFESEKPFIFIFKGPKLLGIKLYKGLKDTEEIVLPFKLFVILFFDSSSCLYILN